MSLVFCALNLCGVSVAVLTIGKWQKLVDFRWEEVKPIDLLKITKLEGQPWISLYHLMAKQVFRERYHINSFRKGQVSTAMVEE